MKMRKIFEVHRPLFPRLLDSLSIDNLTLIFNRVWLLSFVLLLFHAIEFILFYHVRLFPSLLSRRYGYTIFPFEYPSSNF